MNRHAELLRYMMGFHKGAGHNAFTEDQIRDKDFKRGYDDGRKSTKDAYEKACLFYGETLNEILPAKGSQI